MYGYLATMWAESQSDAIHDAKHQADAGHYENNVFYTLQDGKIVPSKNPWK
jgi:hypothetical protein